jgi:xylulokinase
MMADVGDIEIGSNGLFFIPHLRGSLVPNKFPAARGSFVGLNDRHTRAHLARGIVEGLAMEYRIVIDRIEDALQNRFDEVSCFGGGSQNRPWVQVKADVLNRPLRVYKNQENTGLGAAILAGIGSGVYRDWEDARDRVTHEVEMVEPDQKRAEQYESLYENIYATLFKHKKNIDMLIERHRETGMT